MINECGGLSLIPEELISASSSEVAGIDFLYITDSNTHAGLECYMIYVSADAIFNEILVGGSNVVTAKGLSGKTVNAGTMLPFGKAHATSIDLTSGQVVAYIY
jgi:hypothetical protein